ncbi:hypothetical protein TCAL_10728 [Tigriopus californicus]|uniref:C2H2-type domain-containing protein n=1 Tax=Tigriopus californicus TaxID=6832 RepID=A0A553PS70_TIGCA|nr:transcription factor Sp4-like [Tigriopus californicus]TRY80511.1 hypothetical protein TCAL_10728 [Tigriopus californicus]
MAYEAISNGQFQSTINLSDEFTSRHHLDGNNLVVLSSANNNGSVVLSHSAVPTQSTIFTSTGIPVSVVSAASMAPISTVIVSSSDGSIPSTMDPHHHQTVSTSLPLSTVTVDLPSGQGHMPGTATGDENGGVLLCNIDELSRYIPENFYADFSLSDTNNLEATTVASAAPPPIQAPPATAKFSSTPIISLSNGTILQAASPMTTLPLSISSLTQPLNIAQGITTFSGGHQINNPPQMGIPTVIQLPTQPQPPQAVKSMTYVQTNRPQQTQIPINTASLQPVKLTTTGYALTPSGERITIHGLDPATLNKGQPMQIQFKQGGLPQTIQLGGLNIDTSKLTVLQELPENSKVIIQEPNKIHNDSISNILEEMRTDDSNANILQQAGVELATAIPVAVTNLHSKDQQKSFKLKGPPSTIMLPSGKKGPRNIIFAGNNLPPGAIPIQINGLNQLNALPMSAVKSIPMPLNLNTLTQASAPVLTTVNSGPQMVAAKKTKVEAVPMTRPLTTANSNLVNASKVNNNIPKATMVGAAKPNVGTSPGSRQVGNNKTCNWVFENGETCGKTFSKSYNLVVHMRMHEDVRPFQCSMCDQTFRQKAHLQRHETTHGIGSKANRNSSGSPRKRRKSRNSVGASQSPGDGSVTNSQLQARLSHVDDQFGKKKDDTYLQTISSQSIIGGVKRKYSNNAELEEAIRTVINDDGQDTITEIIELKDGTAALLTADGRQKVRRIAIKMDENGRSIITPLDDDDDDSMGHIVGDTFTIQNEHDLRDEDIIENVSIGDSATVVTTASPIMVNSGSRSISETGVGVEGDDEGEGKQIIMNFSDHNPALQREILNAMLADEGSAPIVTDGITGATMVVVTSAADIQGSLELKTEEVHMEESHHHLHDHHPDQEPGSGHDGRLGAAGSPGSNENVQVESQPEFPPVTVQEFTSTSSD